MFIDHVKIFVKAGNGGPGACSFRREKFVPHGGPDGGDGGNGGNIVLQPTQRVTTLLDFRYRRQYEARSGHSGQGAHRHGRNGPDILLPVPLGTMVKDDSTGEILGDLTHEHDRVIVAQGGHGGRGNARFATSTNRVPRRYEPGSPGEERWLALELKLLADVGLVGFPNAGKSTLIATISSARPEIAGYPFTTLRPYLGVVAVDEFHSLVMADIPGLIEGAHEGKGLGLQFLRHIERTRFLLFLIDVSDWSEEDPVASLHILRSELAAYHPTLSLKTFAVAATKMDSLGQGSKFQHLQAMCQRDAIPCFPISAVTKEGLPALIHFLAQQVSLEPPVYANPRSE